MKKTLIPIFCMGMLFFACGNNGNSAEDNAAEDADTTMVTETKGDVADTEAAPAAEAEIDEDMEGIEHETDGEFESLEKESQEIDEGLKELDNL